MHKKRFQLNHNNISLSTDEVPIVYIKFSSSAATCKAKWKSLRDYYIRKRRDNTKKSEQAASNKRQWHMFERMSFLLPFIATRKMSDHLDIMTEAEEESVSVPEVDDQLSTCSSAVPQF